jgi:hypothetical protein
MKKISIMLILIILMSLCAYSTTNKNVDKWVHHDVLNKKRAVPKHKSKVPEKQKRFSSYNIH